MEKDPGFWHWSDCAIHNAPAYKAKQCDCGKTTEYYPIAAPTFKGDKGFG